MRINMTLSQKSDPDLFYLYLRLGGRRFMKTVKETIRASMMGKVGRLIYVPSHLEPTTKDTIVINIVFTSKKDEHVRAYLQKLPSRSRTSYIKTILRLNLGLSFIRDEFLGSPNEGERLTAAPLTVPIRENNLSAIRRHSNLPTKRTTDTSVPLAESPTKEPITTTPQVPERNPFQAIAPVSIPAKDIVEEDDDDDVFSMLTNLIDD